LTNKLFLSIIPQQKLKFWSAVHRLPDIRMTKTEMRIKTKRAVLTLAIICQMTLFSIVLASYGCASEVKIFTLTKKQSGSEIKIKPGDIVQIELPALGSAGYNWYIDKIDGEHLELVSEKTKKIFKGKKVGAPVLIEWQFKAKKQGYTEIKMDHYRKWEGVEKSTDHFFLKIKIL
jgi:predicted secreted protein